LFPAPQIELQKAHTHRAKRQGRAGRILTSSASAGLTTAQPAGPRNSPKSTWSETLGDSCCRCRDWLTARMHRLVRCSRMHSDARHTACIGPMHAALSMHENTGESITPIHHGLAQEGDGESVTGHLPLSRPPAIPALSERVHHEPALSRLEPKLMSGCGPASCVCTSPSRDSETGTSESETTTTQRL
jgi:hypothetical protein